MNILEDFIQSFLKDENVGACFSEYGYQIYFEGSEPESCFGLSLSCSALKPKVCILILSDDIIDKIIGVCGLMCGKQSN